MRKKKIQNILEKNLKVEIDKNKNIKLTNLKNYDSFHSNHLSMHMEFHHVLSVQHSSL